MKLLDHIVKSGSGYKLLSKKTGKNLGTAKSKAGIEKRERQVQFFKHQHEEVVTEKKIGLMKILTPVQKAVNARVDAIMKGKDPDQKKESVAEMAPVSELISFAQYFESAEGNELNTMHSMAKQFGYEHRSGGTVTSSFKHPEGHSLSFHHEQGQRPKWRFVSHNMSNIKNGETAHALHQHLSSIHKNVKEMTQFDGDPRMMKDPLTRDPLDRGPVTGTQYSETDTAGNGDAGVLGGLTPPFDSDLPANITQSPGGYSKNINTPGIPMTMGESPIKKFVRGKWVTPRVMKSKYARPKPRFKQGQ